MKKELYHSEKYLGQEFSDELYHWKYLSRKRKNGRWVYTYKNQDYAKAKSKLDKAERDYIYDTAQYDMARSTADAHRQNSFKNGKISDEEANDYAFFKMFEDEKFSKYKESGAKYVNAKSKFNSVSIKTLPSRIIGNGAAAVANMVSKIGSAISKHVSFKPASLKTISAPGMKKKTYFTPPKLKFK